MANGIVKATNVTKYDAGAAGDNVIPDGYVKTVEKVWIDTYALSATVLTVGTVISIGKVPENKKITSIDIFFPAALSGAAASGTGTTIDIGASITVSGTTSTASTLFLNAGECLTATTSLSANTNALCGGYVTSGGVNTIQLRIGRLATTVTAGNITSIIRYT